MSMLNCCLDYPHVCFVFHLGPPRDIIDYYQAIGHLARDGGAGQSVVYFNPSSLQKPRVEGNDLFGENVIHNMMQDTSLCQQLCPSFFLDGVGIPCAMMPKAQLCDACTAQLSCPPLDSGLHCIPAELLPILHHQPDSPTSHCDEELGHYIHIACDVFAKSYVNCWCHGFEYCFYTLAECDLCSFGKCDEEWQKWVKLLCFPVGCCFYCGCPQKVCLYHAVQAEHSLLVITDCLCGKIWPDTPCP
jgi:hypothetical protein